MATGQSTRTSDSKKDTNITSGIYEAIVVSHLDRTYMGTLLVDILRASGSGALPERMGTTIEARYLMPFYGVTPYDATSANDGYSATQKSYGMWMVPPDVGTRVLVVYVEGISRCYWIGCIPDQYMNFMVPDGRASTELTTNITPENLIGKKLPTGEYNKKVGEDRELNDPTRMRKPYNKDFTQILEVQGLLEDENRGTTTTSARREVPSSVFGINTPGPLDKRQGAPRSLQGLEGFKANVYANRLGGSSFVMDDGDDKLLRKTTADAGPPEYVNKEADEEGGDPTVPHNELVRLRTRTGHQILLHNSEDLIYIGNARGTSWIEITSDGKIDIYANDSISVHSDQDLNFTADRDVNIEGGRNINMRANARYSDGDSLEGTSGNIQMESQYNTYIRADKDLRMHVQGNRDDYVKLNFKTQVDENVDFYTSGYKYTYAEGEISTITEASYKLQSTEGSVNLLANQNLNLQSTDADINLQAGGQIAGDGSPNIFWNSGKSSPSEIPNIADLSAKVELLENHIVPKVTPGNFSSASVQSIVKRMPTHEPWIHHENLNPLAFKPDKTDVLNSDDTETGTVVFTTDTFRKSLTRSASASAASGRRRPPPRAVTSSNQSGELSEPASIPGSIQVPTDLIDYLIEKEGFHAEPYWDFNQWTNGYGTRARSQTERINEQEARRRLEADVARRRAYVENYNRDNAYFWNDDQINALTSFIYNLGAGALDQVTANSTRSNEVIAEKMKLYNKAGGVTQRGLVIRRKEESAWFSQGIFSAPPAPPPEPPEEDNTELEILEQQYDGLRKQVLSDYDDFVDATKDYSGSRPSDIIERRRAAAEIVDKSAAEFITLSDQLLARSDVNDEAKTVIRKNKARVQEVSVNWTQLL